MCSVFKVPIYVCTFKVPIKELSYIDHSNWLLQIYLENK